MNEHELPNQGNDCGERKTDYLKSAAEACESGDLVLGMHLYLAAYEKSAADPSIPDGMALAGLREAWQLACDLKERSMAEYVFEKMEPYLTPDEIAECAGKLQDLALDRLEQIGFSREELEDMAEMITQDLVPGGSMASVMTVGPITVAAVDASDDDAAFDGSGPAEAADASDLLPEADMQAHDAAVVAEGESDSFGQKHREGAAKHPEMKLAQVDDFNPYDEYRDYSIGKSYHAATNEGSGAAIFTRDEERAAAHARFVEDKERKEQASAQAGDALSAADDDVRAAKPAEVESPAETPSGALHNAAQGQTGADLQGAGGAAMVPARAAQKPASATEGSTAAFDYSRLRGYDEVVSIMRDYGVGMQDDSGYREFIAMLNERHGLDRSPALDTLLFRAPAIEDAARFVEATIGELGLPALRMSIEESVQGMPVLCVIAEGNHRPRMNHAHNRFEAPAVLVIEDLDMWTTPSTPEGVEGGLNAFMMANLSRGAREAMNLIRTAVEDPDVYVLATATTSGDVDPFYYELLEPITVIDIGYPTDKERADMWSEIARDHPSIRDIDRDALVRFSAGIPRYDIYIAAREALEDAYKTGLMQRAYVPVLPQNIFEKLAACQPLDSDVYREAEDEVVRNFLMELDQLDDLVDGSRD
ncbi:MAG TPA: ribonucleotide reductase subunit alpha [Eggerthellaceae bacterium]|nr:ribonucleotide reductase subunit alpha [Eggerthellaceae bacterium]